MSRFSTFWTTQIFRVVDFSRNSPLLNISFRWYVIVWISTTKSSLILFLSKPKGFIVKGYFNFNVIFWGGINDNLIRLLYFFWHPYQFISHDSNIRRWICVFRMLTVYTRLMVTYLSEKSWIMISKKHLCTLFRKCFEFSLALTSSTMDVISFRSGAVAELCCIFFYLRPRNKHWLVHDIVWNVVPDPQGAQSWFPGKRFLNHPFTQMSKSKM